MMKYIEPLINLSAFVIFRDIINIRNSSKNTIL